MNYQILQNFKWLSQENIAESLQELSTALLIKLCENLGGISKSMSYLSEIAFNRLQSTQVCGLNAESSLEPDNGPNSKIQLQNISRLNFNVMVP